MKALQLLAGLLISAAVALPTAVSAQDKPALANEGYVPDEQCRLCHAPIWKSYQEVGMARSFARPRDEVFIEDFSDGNNTYFHAPSKRTYEMRRDGDELLFRRYQLDAAGDEINVYERRIDWILGSGHRSRVYLIQTPAGELYQLPIAWYSQSASWAMAPGFEKADHLGLNRVVRRECMFCHNAFPDVAAGSDLRFQAQTFPTDLPEGTGCQRCHGPGEKHVQLLLEGSTDMESYQDAIVNPARLEPERRDDVCDQCHWQPSVAIPVVRHVGVGDYAFRPGDALTDTHVPVDVTTAGLNPEDRFEINHHAYRLRQSPCFEASGRELSCLTCHDPHRKVPVEERAAHYRKACLSCHEINEEAHQEVPEFSSGDCAGCHMPQRRTQDVIEVVMTDHRISRPSGTDAERLQALEKVEREVEDIHLLPGAPEGNAGHAYRALGFLRFGLGSEASRTASADFLGEFLPGSDLAHADAFLDLARAELQMRRPAATAAAAQHALELDPENVAAREWLAAVQPAGPELLVEWRAIAELRPQRAITQFNAGLAFAAADEHKQAMEFFQRALDLNPNMAPAALHLARSLAASGEEDRAIEFWRRALVLDPGESEAYLELGRALAQRGDNAAALRWLQHGAGHARQQHAIQEALKNLEGKS